jgi:MoaA/NifB/PqqE/SkfB family radical SAM enzyme
MVVTNLSLFTPDHIEKIAEAFDFVGVSIDTTRPERYNEIRGRDWLEQIKHNIATLMAGLRNRQAETQVCAFVTIGNRNADEIHDLIHMVFDDLIMDTLSFNLIDPHGGSAANECIPTREQLQYVKQVVLEHKAVYPISNSMRYFHQLGRFDYRCNPWKCVQIDHRGCLIVPCLFLDDTKINLQKQRLSEVWKAKHIQRMYAHYAACNQCNIGCVAESAWSTYDVNFVIKESFRGIILPTIQRIKTRNKGVS